MSHQPNLPKSLTTQWRISLDVCGLDGQAPPLTFTVAGTAPESNRIPLQSDALACDIVISYYQMMQK